MSSGVLLFTFVDGGIVIDTQLKMPPPETPAVLRLIFVSVSASVPLLWMPPPDSLAVLRLIFVSVAVTAPVL